jgi:23S rRNA (pseudouridine1915-N3)-methyltransferase
MKINVYTIEKKSSSDLDKFIQKELKMIQKYAQIKEFSIFNKKISQAQNQDVIIAQSSYSKAFEPYLNGYNIALHPKGEEIDSFEFSKIFDINMALNFFIGGAYGFENSFLSKMDRVISLGRLTLSHKVAKAVLIEQIFRGLSIKNNHPYHK